MINYCLRVLEVTDEDTPGLQIFLLSAPWTAEETPAGGKNCDPDGRKGCLGKHSISAIKVTTKKIKDGNVIPFT